MFFISLPSMLSKEMVWQAQFECHSIVASSKSPFQINILFLRFHTEDKIS